MIKKNDRFPGLNKQGPKSLDSYFSSGKPTKRETKEWADWHGGYKEEDVYRSYLRKIRAIPNDGSLLGHLKMVPKLAHDLAPQYGHQPSKGVLRDGKRAWQGYRHIIEDLVGSGNEGLLKGAKRFRPNAGAKFATAARFSIEKEIRAQAKWLRSVVRCPERKDTPWSKSLSYYDDDEYAGQTEVGSSGFAQSAYQLNDDAPDADHAGPTVEVSADWDWDAAQINPHAYWPLWWNTPEWIDLVERERDLARRVRLLTVRDNRLTGCRTCSLETANSIALWRLGEYERKGISARAYRFAQSLLAELPPEKGTRWRKRKSIPGVWDPLTPFFNPPREVLNSKPDWGVPALWTLRLTYPGRIIGRDKGVRPQWIKPAPTWMQWPDLIKFKYRGRWSWRTTLKLNDWRLKLAQERRESLKPELIWSERNVLWVTPQRLRKTG